MEIIPGIRTAVAEAADSNRAGAEADDLEEGLAGRSSNSVVEGFRGVSLESHGMLVTGSRTDNSSLVGTGAAAGLAEARRSRYSPGIVTWPVRSEACFRLMIRRGRSGKRME